MNHFAKLDTAGKTLCQEALDAHHISGLFDIIKPLISSLPYHLFAKAKENTYQLALMAIFRGMGIACKAEEPTNIGRIDLVVESPEVTYLFELKLDGSAGEGLAQIEDKG